MSNRDTILQYRTSLNGSPTEQVAQSVAQSLSSWLYLKPMTFSGHISGSSGAGVGLGKIIRMDTVGNFQLALQNNLKMRGVAGYNVAPLSYMLSTGVLSILQKWVIRVQSPTCGVGVGQMSPLKIDTSSLKEIMKNYFSTHLTAYASEIFSDAFCAAFSMWFHTFQVEYVVQGAVTVPMMAVIVSQFTDDVYE
jgi:hypothetical protein